MEGQNGITPSQPPAAAAPKSNMKMLLVVAVVAVVVIVAIAAAFVMGNFGGTAALTPWEPKVGDFVKYSESLNSTHFGNFTLTVKSIGETEIVMNETVQIGSLENSMELNISKNQSLGTSFDVEHPPAGYTVNVVGNESISTNWGNRVAEHVQATFMNGDTSTTLDMWIRASVLVKETIEGGGNTASIALIDTNIPQILNA